MMNESSFVPNVTAFRMRAVDDVERRASRSRASRAHCTTRLWTRGNCVRSDAHGVAEELVLADGLEEANRRGVTASSTGRHLLERRARLAIADVRVVVAVADRRRGLASYPPRTARNRPREPVPSLLRSEAEVPATFGEILHETSFSVSTPLGSGNEGYVSSRSSAPPPAWFADCPTGPCPD